MLKKFFLLAVALGVASSVMAQEIAISQDERKDGAAQIYQAQGEATILKKGTDAWVPAEKGMLIEAGDKIATRPGAKVTLALDPHFLNFFEIQENTQAEIRSLEPTDIYLTDGSVFNALDQLPHGQVYQIATPTSVASVRGTHFFASYEAAVKKSTFMTLPFDDQKQSFLQITRLSSGGNSGETVALPEGFQFTTQDSGETDIPRVQKITSEDADSYGRPFRETALSVPGFESLREEGRRIYTEKDAADELNISSNPLYEAARQETLQEQERMAQEQRSRVKKEMLKAAASSLLSEGGLDSLGDLADDESAYDDDDSSGY